MPVQRLDVHLVVLTRELLQRPRERGLDLLHALPVQRQLRHRLVDHAPELGANSRLRRVGCCLARHDCIILPCSSTTSR